MSELQASAAIGNTVALLLTDLVDSAALAQRLGDEPMAQIWAAHDRMARDLLRQWRGREIDKTDGFLLMFGAPGDALAYALDYHRALAQIERETVAADGAPVRLRARAGLHVGAVTVRETPAADVALGAKPLEVDGVTKPLAARVMATALGGQTLMTRAARHALGDLSQRVLSHGFWRVKGLPEPLELWEVGEPGAPFTPPPDGEKVYRVVAQGDLWLPMREVKHSLPAERDAFVGRSKTLLDLAQRLADGARLVSLLGLGGSGKTRLATRFGWSWLGEYPGGVWFCDLAPARSVEGIYNAVAQGLGLPLGPGDPCVQLGQVMASRGRCLVILDNFEQVARHAEETVGHWLARAHDARFLVTTREVLGIVGEEALALAPLQTEDAQQLFLKRAASAKRDFRAIDEDHAAVVQLVRLLDGLPLAIELAAARVRTLAPRALLARMSERFKLLASAGGRLDRQSTLRTAFDWSWDLLQEADKSALAQLSVFEGGFTLEAAEAVINLDLVDGAPWTLDVVNSLVDKSFVRPLQGERFDLLMSVQAYADEHLRTEGRYGGSGSVALQAAWARHSQWFGSLGPVRAIENACADIDNLAVACRRAVHAGRQVLAADALVGAWAALNLQGPFKAGMDLAELVCGMQNLPAQAAARAHCVLGNTLEAQGNPAAAIAQYDMALSQALTIPDPAEVAAAKVRLGALHARAGQPEQGRLELEQALQCAREAALIDLQCAALNGLGTVEFEQGRVQKALVHYEAALKLARQYDSPFWLGNLLGNLSVLHSNMGLLDQARQMGLEALAIARRRADRQREANMLNNLGMLSYLLGDLTEARAAAQAANLLGRELAYLRLQCGALETLGLIDASAGQTELAEQNYEQSLRLAIELGNGRAQAMIGCQLGLMRVRLGKTRGGLAEIQRGLEFLRPQGEPTNMTLALCASAEAHWLAGLSTQALSAAAEARAFALQAGVSPSSESGIALARMDSAITAPAAQEAQTLRMGAAREGAG